MELLLGFAIAALIAITGVGAGTLIAPLLILFLHVPVAEAVGTALAYSAAVKLVVVPVQIWRRQVEWRTLAIMLATGIPGVVIGSLFFQRVAHNAGQQPLALSRPRRDDRRSLPHGTSTDISALRRSPRNAPTHPRWLALVMLPIGAEVGFSSSGAGALGTLALLGLTPLDARRIVGTDLAFGLCLSLIGGTLHLSSAGLDSALLINLDRRRRSWRPRRHWSRLAHPSPHHAPRAFPLALRHGPSALLARAGLERKPTRLAAAFIPQTSVSTRAKCELPSSARRTIYCSFDSSMPHLPQARIHLGA